MKPQSTNPLRVPLVAMLAFGALATLFQFVPGFAPAQDQSNRGDRGNRLGRPAPGPEDRHDNRKVLVMRARGGDLSAVIADGIAANPAASRRFRIVRLDNDEGRDNGDYVLEFSADVMRRDRVGAGDGSIVVVLTLKDPASGKVLGGERRVFRTLNEAFSSLGNLPALVGRLSGDSMPEPQPEPQPEPDPQPEPQPLPTWVNNPTGPEGTINAVGKSQGERDEATGKHEASTDAQRNLDRIIEDAALWVAREYYRTRGRNANVQRAALRVSYGSAAADTASIRGRRGGYECYELRRAVIANTRGALASLATTIIRQQDRRIIPDADEVQKLYSDWLTAQGYAVIDAKPDEPPVELSNRRDLGAGWASVTAIVKAPSVAKATEMAKAHALYTETTDDVRERWDKVQGHQQYSGALGSYCAATVVSSVNDGNGTWTVTLSLRVAYRTFNQWANRILGLGGR